jgi:hypothetical protein
VKSGIILSHCSHHDVAYAGAQTESLSKAFFSLIEGNQRILVLIYVLFARG